jgi:hypothetical protein
MNQPYRAVRAGAILFLIALITACASLPGQSPTATPRPFAAFRAEDVITRLNEAGLDIANVRSDTAVGRGAPATFNTRVIFEIPRIAPGGGQVMTFRTPEDLQTWQDYVIGLRSNPETRRDVVYVYVNQNAMLQLNANLTNAEAQAYRDIFLALE